MARIFITGGTGFIGRHTLSYLARGNECIVLTRRSATDAQNCHYVTGEMGDRERIAALMRQYMPDTLLHFAWDVKGADFSSSEQNAAWLKWSTALADDFLSGGGRCIIASGTCFEYDWSVGGKLTEDSPLRPNSVYGECKVKTYNAIKQMCEARGARFVWGRVFYPYRPDEEKRKLISRAVDTLRRGEVFECRTPNNRIDYVHVEDVASAFAMLAVNRKAQGVYNISSGQATRVGDMLRFIALKLGKEGNLCLNEQDGGDSVWGDNSRIIEAGAILRYADIYQGLAAYFVQEAAASKARLPHLEKYVRLSRGAPEPL